MRILIVFRLYLYVGTCFTHFVTFFPFNIPSLIYKKKHRLCHLPVIWVIKKSTDLYWLFDCLYTEKIDLATLILYQIYMYFCFCAANCAVAGCHNKPLLSFFVLLFHGVKFCRNSWFLGRYKCLSDTFSAIRPIRIIMNRKPSSRRRTKIKFRIDVYL